MTPYMGILRARFRALLQYRTAALAGICTQWLFGMVRVMALCAYYASSSAQQPMTLAQAITYTWVGQAMLGMLPWNIEPELGQTVRTGQVAYELARPMDLYWMWYARCVAYRSAPTLLKSVPQFVITLFLLPPSYRMTPASPQALLAWAVATVFALCLSAAITNLFNISLFWTVTGDGIVRLIPNIILILSGMTVPLPMMPDWLQGALLLQPFSGLVDVPARLFCGNMPVSALPRQIMIQAFWIAALIALGRVLMKRGLKHVTVAGG
jgi:ABC-2 type transport system permease protein